MSVVATAVQHHLEHDGRTFWFCSDDCRRAFARDPSAFVGYGGG